MNDHGEDSNLEGSNPFGIKNLWTWLIEDLHIEGLQIMCWWQKMKEVCNNELCNHKNDWLCLNRQRLLESSEVYEIWSFGDIHWKPKHMFQNREIFDSVSITMLARQNKRQNLLLYGIQYLLQKLCQWQHSQKYNSVIKNHEAVLRATGWPSTECMEETQLLRHFKLFE